MIDPTKALEKAKVSAQSFSAALRDNPADMFNRLFFAARNGAISHLLRELEAHFRKLGMPVQAQWCETSFPGSHIKLVLIDKKTGEHVRRLDMSRVRSDAFDLPSDLVYALQSVQIGDYYRGKPPKIAQAFDAELSSASFQALAEDLVAGANAPFIYASHSSF